MAQVPPPQGMSEVDYAAIEAAVTETVRGRWFLNEFARRTRAAEMRQLLDAMGRVEDAVAAGQAASPADPSVRLLMQRIKDIAGQLDVLSTAMRDAGVDNRFAAAVSDQARAVSGMMRGPMPPRPGVPALAKAPALQPPAVRDPPERADASARTARLAASPSVPARPDAVRPAGAIARGEDPRLAALTALDELPMADKLVLFG